MLSENNNKNGFTLIELILVISLIALLSGLSLSVFSRTQTKNDLNVAISSFASISRNAQIKARLSIQDDGWGVKIEQSKITLFKGNNFMSRDQSQDQITKISPNISISGINELSFAKITGLPSTSGTIVISELYGQDFNINIANNGVINY